MNKFYIDQIVVVVVVVFIFNKTIKIYNSIYIFLMISIFSSSLVLFVKLSTCVRLTCLKIKSVIIIIIIIIYKITKKNNNILITDQH